MLCIIPARRGATRLPFKNTLPLAGKPMIVHTMLLAKAAFGQDAIVSTNDDTVIGLCADYRMRCLIRPDYLCTDSASSWWAVEHACYVLGRFEEVILLQPTSPTRTWEKVQECIAKWQEKQDNVTTVKAGGLPSGNVYIRKWKKWTDFGFWIPDEDTVDVDTKEDFDAAEKVLAERVASSNI